jgi:DNA-binding NtrC family response regulator
VLKPFEMERMALLVDRLLESASIRAEHSYLLAEVLEGEREIQVVGRSAAMQKVRDLIRKVASTRSSVLLLGESGTGKELAAQAIHLSLPSRSHPLIKVNCPGIPTQLFESELFGHMKGAFTGAHESRKGKFELAGKGNILLDEVSEIPFELQAKLLRVLEDRRFTRVGGTAEVKVEARIIAASNRNLKVMVEQGRFRSDLYYRLNVFPISLPPLRSRREDIPETAIHLLGHVASSCGLPSDGVSEEAMLVLQAYDWPGNVRELRNILERALVLAGGGTIQLDHLPIELQEAGPARADDQATFQARVDNFKRELLVETLKSTRWSKKEAAGKLGLTQRAFSHYVAKYGLDSFRSSS